MTLPQGLHLLRRTGDADDPHGLPVHVNGQVDAPAGAGGGIVLADHQLVLPRAKQLLCSGMALPHPMGVRAGQNGAAAVHEVDIPAGDGLHLADDGTGGLLCDKHTSPSFVRKTRNKRKILYNIQFYPLLY